MSTELPPEVSEPRKDYLTTEVLSSLALFTGQDVDLHRISGAIEHAAEAIDGDPLAQLAYAAAEVNLHVTPTTMKLSKAMWQAMGDSPVVIWNEGRECWEVITSAGPFLLRMPDPNEEEQLQTVTRGTLARRLGVRMRDEVEIGLVHPRYPEGSLSANQLVRQKRRRAKYASGSNQDDHHGHGEGHMSPARRFFNMLSVERGDIFTLVVFSLLSGVLYLAVPLAVDAVVSNIAFGGQTQPYIQALLIVAQILTACLALQALINGLQYYISDIIQRRIYVRTTSDFAHRLPRVKASSLDHIHGPELVNRFLDVVTVQKNTSFFLLEGLNLITSTVIGMVMLSFYHPMMLVFVLTLLLTLIFIVSILGRRAVATSIVESKTKYDLVNWFEEIAGYMHLFKGPGGYQMAYEQTNQLATEYVKARTKHFNIVIRQVTGLLVISVVSAVALLVLGTWLVISQQITLGQLVASEIIMSSIAASLIKFGKKLEAWYDTMAAMDKLGHIFDLETESEEGEHPVEPERCGGCAVRVHDVGFQYADAKRVFEHLDFELAGGSHTAILGTQGTGVSTLLDLLFGLRAPTQGHITIHDLDVRDWKLEKLRQYTQLLRRDEIIDASVTDNLRLGRHEISLQEVRDALEEVGLLDLLMNHPEGLNRRLKINGAPLSTSQRIRLLIARALVQKPKLLLVDELLDGLDEATLEDITSCLFRPGRGWTVILSTRHRRFTKYCDQVIELGQGALSAGPVEAGQGGAEEEGAREG